MKLEERLKQARIEANLGVEEAANELGVQRVQLWRMERNAAFISVQRLEEMAKLYGVPLASFFDDNLDIDDTAISYDLIGRAVTCVLDVVEKQPRQVTSKAISEAVVTVARKQHLIWSKDPKAKFNPSEYRMLIEEKLEGG